jgi:hypothetical protein
MKLPRWLVVTLLTASVLAVFGGGAWWWITWPERTAREFVRLVASHDEAAWKAMLGETDGRRFEVWLWSIKSGPPESWSSVKRVPRSLSDLLAGRQFFETPSGWGFLVTRGVIDPPTDAEEKALYARELRELERVIAENERAVAETRALEGAVMEAKARIEKARVEYERLKVEAEGLE